MRLKGSVGGTDTGNKIMSSRQPLLLDGQFATILAAARRNNAWAFERLYTGIAPAVAGYLRLQGAEDPEDLVNEVLLGAFRGLAGFAGDETAWRTWVFAIAHRRLVDDRRKRSRRVSTASLECLGEWEPMDPGADGAALGRVELSRLRASCERLSPDQRDVVLLRLVADMSLEQVAEALGKSTGAVKALQRRGLDALRAELSQSQPRKGVSRMRSPAITRMRCVSPDT